MSSSPIRVVIAKPGLDGHDRGAKVVARALRDAGIEVIYTGLHQTPEMIVETAIQEDADAIGLSVLSGAHMTLFARVIDLLKERGASDIVVFGGGIIPEDDIDDLTALGVAKVFTPGTRTQEIVEWVNDEVGASTAA
ncbi:MAG: isobutyryl-CoA mutase small subunit [Actinomycetota bacterium]|nr:isobutyryl-CoA mutase small subunit [Actinomycetota bacterium]HQZ84289.1 cobalamin B12-binding domain-containing protein [Actinomycetota bacterium]